MAANSSSFSSNRPLVVVERVAEQRERLGERAAAEDHLRAPVDAASSVAKRWKTRTGSSELSTVTAEPRPDAARAPGDRGQHDLGRRDGEVGAVVLADADEVDAQLVGEDGLLDDVADDLRVRERPPVGAARDVAEGVEAELQGVGHGTPWGHEGRADASRAASPSRRSRSTAASFSSVDSPAIRRRIDSACAGKTSSSSERPASVELAEHHALILGARVAAHQPAGLERLHRVGRAGAGDEDPLRQLPERERALVVERLEHAELGRREVPRPQLAAQRLRDRAHRAAADDHEPEGRGAVGGVGIGHV
jgi:hypothetical protein